MDTRQPLLEDKQQNNAATTSYRAQLKAIVAEHAVATFTGCAVNDFSRDLFIALPGVKTIGIWISEHVPGAITGTLAGTAGSFLIDMMSNIWNGKKIKVTPRMAAITTMAAVAVYYFQYYCIPYIDMNVQPDQLVLKDNATANIIEAIEKCGSDPDCTSIESYLHFSTWFNAQAVLDAVTDLIQKFTQNKVISVASQSVLTFYLKELFEFGLKNAAPITSCLSSFYNRVMHRPGRINAPDLALDQITITDNDDDLTLLPIQLHSLN